MSCEATWLGHFARVIETGGLNILVNPFFHDNPSVSAYSKKVQSGSSSWFHTVIPTISAIPSRSRYQLGPR